MVGDGGQGPDHRLPSRHPRGMPETAGKGPEPSLGGFLRRGADLVGV